MSSFIDLFCSFINSHGDKIAVIENEKTITYSKLFEEAIAYSKSLPSGAPIIPVFEDAGIDWYIKVLGIMYAKQAAVPISVVFPKERADFILADIEKASYLPEEAALIYYTSGSTGSPKGVILTHTGLAANVNAFRELFNTNELDRAAINSDPSFDAFILLSLPSLVFGITIYIVPEQSRASLVGLHKFLLKNRIDITFLTTQLAVSYMRTFDNKILKLLLTGGEALRYYTKRSYEVWNLYGPCETTIYVLAHKLTEADEENPFDIPIGKPVGDNTVELKDCEICISGPQVAAGYLNRPDETAKVFIDNMYKTGDLAEIDRNDEFRFRGRRDEQIKISGYRIEPGEIEAKISACEGISSVKVTTAKNDNGEYILTAVCVGDSDENSLRQKLEKALPRAMIPANIKFVSEIKSDPRTGKGVVI
ncbi:MAG: AMP-binding protein [Ruminococcus sp.]|jgi:non-ribosomal peptide synthetase component F|nr:AMP-binding protein [Ruminococcus sp.]